MLPPLAFLREHHPTHHAAIAVLEQALDAYKASLLVKARRLVITATRTVAPSYLQQRAASGQPLPRVAMVTLTDDQIDKDQEEGRKLRTSLAFVVGLEGKSMLREVFQIVMDLLMPSWDPLRRGLPGMGWL
jgi:hypothetical protein